MQTVAARVSPILAASNAAGISWKKVVRSTPPERFSASESVRITKLKVTRKAGIIVKITCESRSRGDTYITVFEYTNPKDSDKVKLSCNCMDFVYRWEYALFRKGGADIHYGDGTVPDKTNPMLIPGCCKHLIAADQVIRERRLV
jgi:hypothetical protein